MAHGGMERGTRCPRRDDDSGEDYLYLRNFFARL